MLGEVLAGAIHFVLRLTNPGPLELGAATAVVNTAVFLLPGVLLYKTAPRLLFKVLLLSWTFLFMLSYWRLSPSGGCP